MVDEGAWDKQRIGIGASPTPPCWLSLRASILRVLGYRPRAAESQGSSAAPRRGRGLKPDLFVSFFIRNSVFLFQIPPDSFKFLQIPSNNGARAFNWTPTHHWSSRLAHSLARRLRRSFALSMSSSLTPGAKPQNELSACMPFRPSVRVSDGRPASCSFSFSPIYVRTSYLPRCYTQSHVWPGP